MKIKRIINWIKDLFKKKEIDMEEFSKNLDEELKKKLKIIYSSKEYEIGKKNIFEDYKEFEKEHKDKIGKFYYSEWGTFKITGIKKPWFLKSPILRDECNFYWKFDEEFLVEPLDNYEIDNIPINELEDFCTEVSKESIIKQAKDFALK